MSEPKFIMAAVSLFRKYSSSDETTDWLLRISVGHETHTIDLWRSVDKTQLEELGVPTEEL